MFSRLFQQMTEPFLNAGQMAAARIPPDSVVPGTSGTYAIKKRFAVTLPNALYVQPQSDSASLPPMAGMTTNPDPRFTKSSSVLSDDWIETGRSGDLLSSRQASCVGSGQGDQFDHLTSLAGTFDKRSRARCGWVYNNSDYKQGRGAFGTADGAFQTSTSGTWMWNLEAAKEKYHAAICAEVRNCEDLDAPQYAGRCGWCTKTGKAVPIAAGKVAYPYNPLCGCPGGSVVTTPGSCTKPPPPLPPGAPRPPARAQNPATICTPLANGNIPRDCIILKAKQAGCSDNGTLITALNQGSDSNYFDTLSQAASYILYQQRAAVGLDENSLSSGKTTIGQALSEFKRVSDQASSDLEGGLQFAARDLCNRSGTMETFDFCTEILDSTLGPFSFKCIQDQFLRMGGQKTGTMYPSPENQNQWNSMNKWADVKEFINRIAENTKSANRATQQTAMMQFYGIPLEDKSMPRFGAMAGVEIFWFINPNDHNLYGATIFMGRRIRNKLPFMSRQPFAAGSTPDLKGNIVMRDGIEQFVSMNFFANLNSGGSDKTIRVRITSDDGAAVTLNKPFGPDYKNGKNVNNENELVAINYGNNTVVTEKPWTLSGTLPNILRGVWFQGGGGYYFKMETQDYTPGTPGIPPDCGVAGTAGGNIRLYTKTECDNVGGLDFPMGGERYPNGECLIRGGRGSFSALCGVLNGIANPVAATSTPWEEAPANMLNLTQEPYAPMISFQVYRAPQTFNADFNFADKRLGSMRMRWMTYTGTPMWVYKPESQRVKPLGLPIVRFRSDSSMRMISSLKMYSFMSMTVLMIFNTLPNTANTQEYMYFFGELGRISIRVRGGTGNSGQLMLYAEGGGGQPQTLTVPLSIKAGVPYLLVLRSLRDTENDIYSVSGISLDAQEMSVLQKTPGSLQTTGKMSFSNPKLFSNPDSMESRSMIVGAADMDLSWIRLFDYDIDEDGIAREMKNNWQHIDDN